MDKIKQIRIKKILAVLLATVICFTTTGCSTGKESKTPQPGTNPSQEQTPQISTEGTKDTAAADSKEPGGNENTAKEDTQKENEADKKVPVAKGRFIETSMSLEEWIGEAHPEERLLNVLEEDGKLNIYTVIDNKTVVKYEFTSEQSIVRSVPGWINNGSTGIPNRIFRGQDGKRYCTKIVNNSEAESSVSENSGIELIVSESEEKGKKVPLAGKYVIMLDVLKNGDIIAISNGGNDIVLYSGSTGKAKCHIPDGPAFAAVGEYVAVVDVSVTNLTLYDTKGVKVHSIPVEGTSDSSILIQGYAGDIYLVSQNGIFRTGVNGTIWEGIVDGKLNSIGSPSSDYQQLEITETGDFYLIQNTKQNIFFGDSQENIKKLHRFAYDTQADSVPQQQLVIYGLRDNPTIRQAIAVFQGNHPEVMISYIAAETNFGTITTEDYIRTLNMELMGGKGPDILLLDGLPADQYIKKEILVPLDSIIEQGEELLPNVRKALCTETACYGIPVKVTLPLMMVGKGMEEQASSLKQLASYVSGQRGVSTLTFKNNEELINNLYDVYGIELIEAGKIDRDGLTSFLESIKTIRENQISNPKGISGAVLIGSKFVLGVPIIFTGFSSLQQPFTAVGEAGGGYLQLTGDVTANGTLAVNAASSNIELAKQFIQECLSYEVQQYDLDDGFPVNQKAMDKLKTVRTRSSFCADFTFNGKEYLMSVSDIGIEKTEELVNLIEKLPITVEQTDAFKNILCSEAIRYLRGERTLHETMQNITGKAELLLME